MSKRYFDTTKNTRSLSTSSEEDENRIKNNRLLNRDNKLLNIQNSASQHTRYSFEEDGEFVYKRSQSPGSISGRKRKKINTPVTQIHEDSFPIESSGDLKDKQLRYSSAKLKSPFGESEDYVSDRHISPYNQYEQYQLYRRNEDSKMDRLRQLIVSSMKKQMEIDEEAKENDDKVLVNTAKVIKDEILQDLMERRIFSSWRNKSSVRIDPIIVPNPLNESNAENIRIYTKRLKQLQLQKHEWLETFKNAVSPVETVSIKNQPSKPTDHNIIDQIENNLKDVRSNLKIGLSIDKLYHKSYQLLKSTEAMSCIKDESIKNQVDQLLQNYINSKEKTSPKDLLKAICQLES